MAAYAVVLVVAYVVDESGGPVLGVIGKYAHYLPITAAGGIAMFVAAQRGFVLPATRVALRWIGAGLFGMCVGMMLYIWSREIEGTAYGIPLLGDIAFLTSYVAVLIGLLTLPRRAPDLYEGWKVFLDAATLILGVSLLGWFFIIRPTTVGYTTPVELGVRIAYPLLDIAFLFAVNGVLIAGGPADSPRGFRWLAAAVNMYVFAESLYQLLYYAPRPRNQIIEHVSEVAFAASYVLFLGAALRYAEGRRAAKRRRIGSGARMSPLSLATTGAVALVLTVVALRSWSAALSPLILGIVGLMVLLLLRQGLTAAQNSGLLRQQVQREGDARVAALVRHASDLIMVAGRDGAVRFASPSAERILGARPETVVGRNLRTLLHPDDLSFLASLAQDDAITATTAVRLRAADDSWRELEVMTTDLTDEAAIEGIVLVARDLTERNALEARLRQSQKMEAVGRLAGGVAHDFNNLLTTILASTDMVLEGDLTTDARGDLELVRQAAGRAAGLTGQLLAFSRQEVLQRRPIELRRVVDDTVNLLRRLLGPDIAVRVRGTDLPLWVAGDGNQLAQVIINLALNARDAMPSGGVLTIALDRVSIAPQSENAGVHVGDFVTLAVGDNGTGMDGTTRSRMFEPFFTTKAAGQGTGLGLATTHRIVEQHEGWITVDSESGRGTTLTIHLADASADAPSDVTDTEAVVRADIGPTGTELVLLVEDEAAVRSVTERILVRLGYRVLAAADAGHARRLLADCTTPPDLLLTDVMMPGMTGPELAAVVLAEHPDLQVLFISGYPGGELRQLGMQGEDAPFLQKPFTPHELAVNVRSVLDERLPRRRTA